MEMNQTNTNRAMVPATKTGRDDTDYIDLLELFYAILRNIWVVILATILAAVLAFGITKFLITPMYTSTSTMIVLTKETTLSSLADLQMGSQLTNDYEILIKTDTVLDAVIKKLKLDMTKNELSDEISITNPQDSRVLKIAITDSDPERAAKIVNSLSEEAAEYIGDMMEVSPPKIAERGKVPAQKTSPSYSKNILIGALLGFLLAIALISIRVIMNDSIQTEEDIEYYLGIPVLATVPEKVTDKSSQKTAKEKKGGKKGGRAKHAGSGSRSAGAGRSGRAAGSAGRASGTSGRASGSAGKLSANAARQTRNGSAGRPGGSTGNNGNGSAR